MSNRSFCRRGVAGAVVLLLATATSAVTTVTTPYQGITYIQRSENSPRGVNVNMNIVEIDLSAPGIHFGLTSPGGTRDTLRQTMLDVCQQQQAQVAINCHFFTPVTADPNVQLVGLAASAGNIFSPFEPQPIGEPNQPTGGYPDQSYAILTYPPALNIDANNNASHYRSRSCKETSELGLQAV